MILPIIQFDGTDKSPLRQIAKPVELKDIPYYNELVLNMDQTVYANHGLGLAAPQVGQNIQLFITVVNDVLRVYFNPQIHWQSKTKSVMEEGCLSVPNKTVTVSRPDSIDLEFYDALGKYTVQVFVGLEARAILHEYDHLQGRLIIDYENQSGPNKF